MDFKRILFAFFLFLFTTQNYAYSNQGIAFVHGTNDHREDAYGTYWNIGFIEDMAQSLPNPENYFVVHCDFSKYMWDEAAGGCVVEQLAAFIKEKSITDLTVYTHSNGGNVLRWVLSNPTYNKNYLFLKNKITQVIAISPSSAGTPLADMVFSGSIFGSNLAWLLGFNGDAIKQQRLGDMHIYNEELLFGTEGRPSLPIPFKTIISTNVVASPFISASYCNGYLLNSGLKLTQLYLDACADGFLNCSSQIAAGEVWFYDKDKLDNNLTLSHNQSRYSCFGLDKMLISALGRSGTPM